MLRDLRKEHQLFAVVTADLQNLNELLQDVGAWPDSELTGALKRTILLPFGNARFAEEGSAILTLHPVDGNLQANAADHRVLKLFVHLAVHDP